MTDCIKNVTTDVLGSKINKHFSVNGTEVTSSDSKSEIQPLNSANSIVSESKKVKKNEYLQLYGHVYRELGSRAVSLQNFFFS